MSQESSNTLDFLTPVRKLHHFLTQYISLHSFFGEFSFHKIGLYYLIKISYHQIESKEFKANIVVYHLISDGTQTFHSNTCTGIAILLHPSEFHWKGISNSFEH